VSIGPAAEALSLIASVIHERKAAGRNGLGAVMGAKRLKAIAVRGTGKIKVADENRLKALRKEYTSGLLKHPTIKNMSAYGTSGSFSTFLIRGDAAIKNWGTTDPADFPNHDKINGDKLNMYLVKKYSCFRCPVACSGLLKLKNSKFKLLGETKKPEYETLTGFGSMCLNDNLESIIKANEICNRYGVDTISAGTTIAFAIECYENGIIGKSETEGIELTWGNADAIVAMLNKMVKREGFGHVLADGVKWAAQRIGKGAERFAIHIGGQEPGFRDPRYIPGRGLGYIADPAPGRHTASTTMCYFIGSSLGPYPELQAAHKQIKENRTNTVAYAISNKYGMFASACGMCFFALMYSGLPLIEFISAVTGWDFTLDEALTVGHRIHTLRHAFNIREGILPTDFHLPNRMSDKPTDGPIAGTNYDFESLRSDYFVEMGWGTDGSNAKEQAEKEHIKFA